MLNLLFLAIVVVLRRSPGSRRRPRPRWRTRPRWCSTCRADLVEQHTARRASVALPEALGRAAARDALRDVLAALDAAARRPAASTRALLVLDDMDGAGLATLREVGGRARRASEAAASRSSPGARPSTSASTSSPRTPTRCYLHPLRQRRRCSGYRRLRAPTTSDALDKLGVTRATSFQAGQLQELRSSRSRERGPSPEALEARRLRCSTTCGPVPGPRDVETRAQAAGRAASTHADRRAAAAPARPPAATRAKLALNEKLVDGLKTRDELRALLIERGRRPTTKHETFRQIASGALPGDARTSRSGRRGRRRSSPQGEIVDGDAAARACVGGRVDGRADPPRARGRRRSRPCVLRVDSPGGSVFAAELIRQRARADARRPASRWSSRWATWPPPAATGSRWPPTRSIADPATITGSIGVVRRCCRRVDRTLEKLGAAHRRHDDHLARRARSTRAGRSTRALRAGAADRRRPRLPRVHRHAPPRRATPTPEQIDEVAQGRVWTGRAGHRARAGRSPRQAIRTRCRRAATRGGLGDDYRVAYIEREPRGIDRLLGCCSADSVAAFVGRRRPVRAAADCRAVQRSARTALAAQRCARSAGDAVALPVPAGRLLGPD
ncbi:MAG: hypothetical protein MZW92_39850 [Comamonadaceae bacterium]|nr:hypothetical protein [Comamonadaceae bacterium]